MRAALPTFLLAVAALTSSVQADIVEVTVNGEVEFNLINPPPLGDANPGDLVSISFLLNSNDFVNSGFFPTRGYVIDQSSFSMTLGSVTVALENPFPAGQTPYFVLRDNDPAVDGFFIATSVDFPTGVPLDVTGAFGQFSNNFSVGYTGGTLSSLDILDAVGNYDFTGLQVFGWNIQDGPFDAMGMIFADMTIAVVSECFLVVGDGPGTSPFFEVSHMFQTQVGPLVEDSYPVLLTNIPEFVLPTPARVLRMHQATAPGLGGSASTLVPAPNENTPDWMLDGKFSVQVVMWNPAVFPGLPEQFTAALYVTVLPDGSVITEPYGTNVGGLEIKHEIDTNAKGEKVIRFPFSIPGF